MKYLFFYIFSFLLFFKVDSKDNEDIFEYTKNLKFCGADILSKKINYPEPNTNQKKARRLSTVTYKPIRVYVETTYFDYQAEKNPEFKNIVPIIKVALNKSVEGIKGLLEVEDKGDINYFKDVIIDLFNKNKIEKWDPIFDKGADIKSDFLIIVKFDTDHEFPQGVLASAVPIYLDPDTNRPLVGLLVISTEKSFFNKRRVTEYFSEVILHELTHALGFLYDMFPYFPNGLDATLNISTVRGYERTHIKTKKVAETARKYFNCDNIIGIELEDQGMAGSALSHWDQRILLGDYMGAVIYQEEMVVSEFTLALLEDSGWYKANYYTGGLMRFGKNKGCDFIRNNCLDSYYNTQFPNEFFDSNETYSPSCSAGRQSRTYSILNSYYNADSKYPNNFIYNFNSQIYYSGAIYTADYCFTHGQRIDETDNGYFTGNCKYGIGTYGNNIYYFNSDTNNYENGHPNSEFPEDLGEIYSDTSFCILSSLSPLGKYKLYSSVAHSMCYQIYCSSLSLTIKINNDLIVCPREGGNIKVEGYDGYLHCPDYNLMCSGTVVCNDMFDCIAKKSLVKESSYIYDYKPITTQKYSAIGQMSILPKAYELSEDGFCPKYCSQCYSNKTCKICQEGQDCTDSRKNETDEIHSDEEAENITDSTRNETDEIHSDEETENTTDSTRNTTDEINPNKEEQNQNKSENEGNKEKSKTTLWIVLPIVITLVVAGIIIAVVLIYKKRKAREINIETNKDEMMSDMGIN